MPSQMRLGRAGFYGSRCKPVLYALQEGRPPFKSLDERSAAPRRRRDACVCVEEASDDGSIDQSIDQSNQSMNRERGGGGEFASPRLADDPHTGLPHRPSKRWRPLEPALRRTLRNFEFRFLRNVCVTVTYVSRASDSKHPCTRVCSSRYSLRPRTSVGGLARFLPSSLSSSSPSSSSSYPFLITS